MPDPNHLGDNVLKRAAFFFGKLASKGEITSPEVVEGLGLKDARNIPANLTIALKEVGLEAGPRTALDWR